MAGQIAKTVPGTTGYTIPDAVAKIPGVSSVSQTFGILVGMTFVISIVVIGFFFLILTVQKCVSSHCFEPRALPPVGLHAA